MRVHWNLPISASRLACSRRSDSGARAVDSNGLAFFKLNQHCFLIVFADNILSHLHCMFYNVAGGTMDVTAHEIDEDDNIKEIYHATGGDFGGTKVDKQFQDLLDKVFGGDFMDDFRRPIPPTGWS